MQQRHGLNISEKYLISAKKHKKSDALHQAFYINEGGVAGYGSRMKAKYTVNWGVQIAGMIFQTIKDIFSKILYFFPVLWYFIFI